MLSRKGEGAAAKIWEVNCVRGKEFNKNIQGEAEKRR